MSEPLSSVHPFQYKWTTYNYFKNLVKDVMSLMNLEKM